MSDLIFNYALVKNGQYFNGTITDGLPEAGEQHRAYWMTAAGAAAKVDHDPRFKGFKLIRVS